MTPEHSLDSLTQEAIRIISYISKDKKLYLDNELISLIIERLVTYKDSYEPNKGTSITTWKMIVCKNEIYNFIRAQKANKRSILTKAYNVDDITVKTINHDDSNQAFTVPDKLGYLKPCIKTNISAFDKFLVKEIMEYVETLTFEEKFLFKSYYLDRMVYSEIAEILNTTPQCQIIRMQKLLAKIKNKFSDNKKKNIKPYRKTDE